MNVGISFLSVEPNEWFVVFHRSSINRVLSFLAFGELKHVSAFGYCAGVKVWVVYDVRWSGTHVMLMDRDAIVKWTADCEILKVERGQSGMAMSARVGFYCVSAIKHLIRLRCVAVTPEQLYRHIIRNGGVHISGRRTSTCTTANPGGPQPRQRAAGGAKPAHQAATGSNPG